MQANQHNRYRPKILVAEDGPGDRELIRRALVDEDLELCFVRDGTEARNYLQSAETADDATAMPALIILDLNMPRCNGMQVLEWLRGEFDNSATPAVIFSSSDNPDDIRNCYRAGCSSYVVKPTDLDPFNAALRLIAKYWLEVVSMPAR